MKEEDFHKKQETYNYFPFTYGEQVESFRAGLKAQLKNDLHQHLEKAQRSSNSNFYNTNDFA